MDAAERWFCLTTPPVAFKHCIRSATCAAASWTAPVLSLHYPQFCAEFRPIPKGLRPPAQGCRVGEATLGAVPESVPTPTGLRPANDDDATPLGLRPSPRGFPRVARRSQPLGFTPESRWDSFPRHSKVVGNTKSALALLDGSGEFESARGLAQSKTLRHQGRLRIIGTPTSPDNARPSRRCLDRRRRRTW
jgi:hypothetical protein